MKVDGATEDEIKNSNAIKAYQEEEEEEEEGHQGRLDNPINI
jgi:hypothetical protein